MRSFYPKATGAPQLLFWMLLSVAFVLICLPCAAQSEQASKVKACATAYEQAQVNRNAGKLVEAQEHLRVCVQDVCPDFVKTDCGQWLSDIKRDMPSVLFTAVDSAGKELVDVEVKVDGDAIELDGIPIELNPGQHDVSYEYEGETFEQQVVVRQGEKNRVLKLEVETDKDSDGDGILDSMDACPTQAGIESEKGCPAAAPPPQTGGGAEGLRTGAYVGWGVGGVGLLTWGVFALLGQSADEAAREECPTRNSCDPERERELVDGVDSKYLIANIGLGVGIAGAATGTVLYFLSFPGGDDDDSADEAGVKMGVEPAAGGGLMSIRGAF